MAHWRNKPGLIYDISEELEGDFYRENLIFGPDENTLSRATFSYPHSISEMGVGLVAAWLRSLSAALEHMIEEENEKSANEHKGESSD